MEQQQNVYIYQELEPKIENCGDQDYFKAFLEFIMELDKVSVPTNIKELVAYVFLLCISWYMVILASRLIHRLVKPFLVVTAATFLFSYVRTLEAAHLKDLIKTLASFLNNGIVKAMETFFRVWHK